MKYSDVFQIEIRTVFKEDFLKEYLKNRAIPKDNCFPKLGHLDIEEGISPLKRHIG